ncbi:uncharacterized protein C8Q71DRAFT_567428 [Rhodofomes roseus]|uniref:DUF6534 domain-containing protein n=1 Tax=Rhodofomes roseus TaxID=34475 RepID=A0ABQ8KK73_9APHY|nr:uncharacterized protein C8Q71DRAFT_567428 [Rhodofomes roseus]KAH9837893.1 hypothetical protein C8Q71DRAFT_567428 [Rhodofomes roseus]
MAIKSESVEDLAISNLLTYLLHWALQGVLAVQVYFYHVHFPNDRLQLKCLVYGVFIFEWVNFGLFTEDAFITFVYNASNNIEAYYLVGNEWFAVPIIGTLGSAVVQCFFAWRIYMLSRLWVLVGAIISLCMVQIVAGILTALKLREAHSIGEVVSSTSGLVALIVLGASTALLDIISALSMIILLLRQKTGTRRSTQLINKVVFLTLETGGLTASVAVAGIVLASVFPDQTYYAPAVYNQSKLYAITLLTHLLNRVHLRQIPSFDVEDISIPLSFAQETVTDNVEPSAEEVKPAATGIFVA